MIEISGYKITEKVNEGRASVVYRGVDEHNHSFILKVLKTDSTSQSEVEKLNSEYEIIKQIDSEGIIKVYGLKNTHENIVLILEDFKGISIKNYIKKINFFNVEAFLEIAIKIVESVEELHKNNIIHKDLKPHNLLFNPETGQIKLIDFGSSSMITKEAQDVTLPNILRGTLKYISPEQTGRMNKPVDYRTDFYSLGITFYEMLTGQVPFNSDDPMELVHFHIAKQPVFPHKINKKIPEALSYIIMKLLAKNAEDRYKTAYGLKLDLQVCLDKLFNTGEINDFFPGKYDVSDELNISKKLYGREGQFNTLLRAFEHVSSGNTEIVLISGVSGIGKSTLINHIQEKMSSQKAYTITGKFEKFKRNTPYYSIIQAFKMLIRIILTESNEKLQEFRQKIFNELGSNVQVIVDIIPEIEHIIGKKFNIQKLEPKESQNRFNLVLQKFISIFARPEHPLVLRLEDLQWADSASLNLLKALVTEHKIHYLLIIGTYRDNEMQANNAFTRIIDELKSTDVSLSSINLQPLSVENINQMLSDTFNLNIDHTSAFADLIFDKTQGNPFFINEFLKSLYEKKLIEFRQGTGWTWNLPEIKKMQITENVVELMVDKLNKLSKETLETLKIAACIGSRFSFETLAIACNKTQEETFRSLIEAINEGIILIMEDFQKFLHDKVQEAAYSLIPENNKKYIHYKIGRLLLQNTPPEDLENMVFDIVNQLNFGIELVSDQEEKYRLANLNLIAGRKAKASTAYSLALKYFKIGMGLLDANSWESQYDLSYGLNMETAECEYLITNFLEAEKLFDVLLSKARNNIEKARVYEIKVVLYITMNKMKQAVETGIEGLKLFNVRIPLNKNIIKLERVLELIKAKVRLNKIQLANLIDLPVMEDNGKIIVMNLMIGTVTAAYMYNTDLMILVVLKMVNISLVYGNSNVSSYAYAAMAMILGFGLGDYEKGFELGKVALKINEKFNNTKLKCKVNFIFATLVSHWQTHCKTDINLLINNFKYGMEAGDLLYSGYSVNHLLIKMFTMGENLDNIYKLAKNYSGFIVRIKDSNILDAFILRRQIILNLKGQTYSPLTLSDDNFNEEKFYEAINKRGTLSTLSYAYIIKLQMYYLFESYNEAHNTAIEIEKYISGSYGNILIPEYYFYYSLTLTAIYSKSSSFTRKKYNKILEKNQKKMKTWAENCQENFLHKYLLVEAEIAQLSGDHARAIDYYNDAIKYARKDGYIQNQAIANELAARFFLSNGHEIIAKEYVMEAYNCYNKWGAKNKAVELEKKYSYFFVRNKSVTKIKGGANLSGENDFELDFITIMKASQTLSGEIVLNKLMEKLMRIVIENAGAERGFLILKNKEELFIEAEGSVESQQTKLLQSVRLEDSNFVSQAIVNYVERTQKDVVINNALIEGLFTTDPYILQNKPKSILCIPIIKQSILLGILYLENNLTANVFTADRLQVLKLLASQAAISLENAKLYDEMRELNLALEQHKHNLEDMVNKRTKQLKITQKKLLDSAHSSGMAEIATGVLHNIGNILNSVNISSQVILETVETSKIDGLLKANQMLNDNLENVNDFINNDPKGKKLLPYYISVGDMIKKEHKKLSHEVKGLSGKISLMKDVIATQQGYAKTEFFDEQINLINIVEDALSLQLQSLIRHGVTVSKNYNEVPDIFVQKSKLINVLMNLIKNAKEAVDNNAEGNKIITIEINQSDSNTVNIKMSDNGVGIPKENLNKIFTHGFTTKKSGHGFGLHTCANSMTEMGGKLSVKSDEPGKGATFKLTFPINK
jgi:predicted ATPase/GAF domain-containing protein/tRNA A-37 threonylcarbamoyl transferase component Bud32